MEVGTVGGGSGSGRQDCAHVGPVLEMTVGDTVVARRVAMTPLQANGGGRGAVQPLVGSFKFQILNSSVQISRYITITMATDNKKFRTEMHALQNKMF